MKKRIWFLFAGAIGGALLLARSWLPAAPAFDRAGPSAPVGDEVYLEEIPADEWLNPNGAVSGADLKGDVVLVEFWTHLCYNCKNIEPWMKKTWSELGPEGLRIVAVHTPEFRIERDVDRVRRYLTDNEITYPVAIDNSWKVWRRYNTTNAWPAFLVFDRSGRLVYVRAGEGAVHGARKAIERALAEPAHGAVTDEAERLGATVSARVHRVAPRRAVLEVTLAGRPGHRVVRSPVNEVWIERTSAVDSVAGPLWIGDPFTGQDASDITYLDGPASTQVDLLLSEVAARGAPRVSGWVEARACSEGESICKTGRIPFSVTVSSFEG